MRQWFLSLSSIAFLGLGGILMSLFYLRRNYRRKERNEPELDYGYRLLAALSFIAFLSMGLFIFIMIFSTTW